MTTLSTNRYIQARRRGGGGGGGGGGGRSKEPPLEVNNGGLKTQTVVFQLLANTGGMENKIKLLQHNKKAEQLHEMYHERE